MSKRRVADSAELRTRLALWDAVADSTQPFELTEDNSKGACVSLREAAERNLAVVVRVRPEILALDADDAIQAREARRIARVLERRHGIESVLVSSGGPGRMHLFARIDDPDVMRRAKKTARSRGIDVRSAIRPPLAAHRLGHPVHLLRGLTPIDALDRLVEPVALSGVSTRISRLIRYGGLEADEPDRSAVLHSIILGCAHMGCDAREVYKILLDPSMRGGERLQEERRKPRGSWRYFLSSWEDGLLHVAIGDVEIWGRPAMEHLGRVLCRALDTPMPGNTGASNLRLILAHIQIASRLKRLSYRASARELAELAGVTARTALLATRRLEAMDLVRRLNPHSGREIGAFSLVPPTVDTIVKGTPPKYMKTVSMVTEDMDLWTSKGLGACLPTFLAICLGDDCVDTIRRRFGYSEQTIRRHVSQLEAVDLVAWDGSRLEYTGIGLTGIAETLGASGTTGRRRQLHQNERWHHEVRRENASARRSKKSLNMRSFGGAGSADRHRGDPTKGNV